MHKENHQTFLPVVLNITGKKIVIVGGGRVGLHKATILNRFTQEATVVSPSFREGFEELPFRLVQKEYQVEDIQDAFLVYVCTENEELNARIKHEAERLGVLASVCDNPDLCDFISPAIFKQDNICIAVSSNAKDVHRSIRIRNRIGELAEENKELLT